DIEIEATVLIDLIAERGRRRLSFPGGVTLATATADVKIVALCGVDAAVPIDAIANSTVLRLALLEPPRAALDFHERARRREAGLQDDVDHAAHVLAAVDDRGWPADDFDPIDVGERQLGDVGGPGTVAVDQHEYLALEVTPLAIRGCAADVDRGLTGRPFA